MASPITAKAWRTFPRRQRRDLSPSKVGRSSMQTGSLTSTMTLTMRSRDCLAVLGQTHAERITTMVTDVINQSQGGAELVMGQEVQEATNRLKDFLFDRVYRDGAAGEEAARVRRLVTTMFGFYMENPDQVPGGPPAAARGRQQLARVVCDYLAGMTDRFAAQQFQLHFLPPRWRGT